MRINSVYNYNYTNACKSHFQSFGLNFSVEETPESSTGCYNHATFFFKDYLTNEFVKEYIKNNMGSKPEINIVSAGCSSGEEVYSIAMMLDDIGKNVNITGFDASEKEIKTANEAVYSINEEGIEGYLIKPLKYLRNYVCGPDTYRAEKFQKYFELLKKEHPYDSSISAKLKKDALNNCKFFRGYVQDLSKNFKENSIDVLMVRNVLNHILFRIGEKPRSDSREIFMGIAHQMKEVIAPGGLVVMGNDEDVLMSESEMINDVMEKSGFEPIGKVGIRNNIWRKAT